jgi:hypothetical protein
LAIDKESAAVERAGKCSSEELLGADSLPLATTSRISSCSNKEPCITAPHSDHLNPRIIGCDLSRGHGGCLLGNVC